METDNIGWRRDDPAGIEVQGRGLIMPDPGNFLPATVATSRTGGAIGISPVERSGGRHAGLRRRTRGEPSHPCLRRLDALREPEPSLALGRPPAIVRNPLAFRLEYGHRRLSQEDPTTLDVANYDAAPAAGAQPVTIRDTVEQNSAIRT
jgi:hypothetical protein